MFREEFEANLLFIFLFIFFLYSNGCETEKKFLVRKNIEDLDRKELRDLREAFHRLYSISGEGGYQDIAGIHGLPLPYQGEHGNLLFLPWHRAYPHRLEQALQEHVPGVTIPYWDWTSKKSIRNGIPNAYAERTNAKSATQSLSTRTNKKLARSRVENRA